MKYSNWLKFINTDLKENGFNSNLFSKAAIDEDLSYCDKLKILFCLLDLEYELNEWDIRE